MKIRIGIEYKYPDTGVEGRITEVNGKDCSGEFIGENRKTKGLGIFSDKTTRFLKDFKSGECILTKYPYQIGDIVLAKEDSGYNEEECHEYIKGNLYRITDIDNKYNTLNTVSINPVNINGKLIFQENGWGVEKFRPAFDHEINGTKEEVISEDLSYLVDIFKRLEVV